MIDAKDNVSLNARADETPMHGDTVPSKPVVLFLCDGKHGASLMAAAVMVNKASSFFDVHCAHTSSTMHTAQASKALIQFQLSTSGITPSPLAELRLTYVDYLVAMNPAAVQSGLPLPDYGKFVPWDVTEHSEAGLTAVLRTINQNINYFLSLYLFR
ncbi:MULTISPECIES: hypothetical protein [unclassified Salinivibrio]|uniref:hypothetical protein n=1 Tax=unclassified Salinivibrio TaxID=2636825 RepID=UPI0009841551|nr:MULTISPECIES: hypothetical protein [unclassified Salinivibrio]MPS31351.1 hypothetical protein [Salinivibrio sp. VYel7]MPX92084.1 hypothetical protein [Salinivibrio sp. VYel1]MPX92748.1 hypothetical protein [Salinivibrio sp. VYel9]MPX95568.1 hypothetical protein [Salinivibrio sp. VYel6]MPX98966.1 hypothetical protein [Salinivibrio sp. VYel4]